MLSKKIRFKLKKLIFDIFFFIYNFLPNRKLGRYFFFTKSDKYQNYYKLYNTVQQLIKKKKIKKVLEIGVGGHDLDYQGGGSLRGLSYFFTKAKVYGIDLMEKKFLDSSKIKTFIGSQNDSIFLNKFGKENGAFDIIIDDGSHFVNHQFKTFHNLYKYLNNDGIYILEDLSGSYKISSNGDPKLSPKKNVPEFFSKLVHSTNSKFLTKKILKKKKYLDISKILFFEHAIVIQKKNKVLKGYSKKLAFQKLSKLNRNRKKTVIINNKKVKPFKTKLGLIKFRN